jgi:hypothetical protein
VTPFVPIFVYSRFVAVIDCGSLGTIIGFDTSAAPTDTVYDSAFNFTCIADFSLDGVSGAGTTEVRCMNNGLWDLGNLTCNGTSMTLW